MWIDWRRDGNLVACAGEGRNIKIYDRRAGSIVRSFNMLHNGENNLVTAKWLKFEY